MAAALQQTFERYQRARVEFVQAVSEAASRPHNVEALAAHGVISALRPLLMDTVRSAE